MVVTEYYMTDAERNLLKYIYAKNGRRTKTLIRDFWETGIADHRLCSQMNDEQMLQQMRNTLGPSWLAGVKLGEL